jgi:hypothetical protein
LTVSWSAGVFLLAEGCEALSGDLDRGAGLLGQTLDPQEFGAQALDLALSPLEVALERRQARDQTLAFGAALDAFEFEAALLLLRPPPLGFFAFRSLAFDALRFRSRPFGLIAFETFLLRSLELGALLWAEVRFDGSRGRRRGGGGPHRARRRRRSRRR